MDTFKWIGAELPPKRTTRVEKIMNVLKTRPGDWALIDENVSFFGTGWILPIKESEDFELHIQLKGQHVLGPRNIYARYIGDVNTERPTTGQED